MDILGWYIATLHNLLGHDKAALALFQPVGDKEDCILCQYERGEATKAQVIERIGKGQ